MGDLLLQVVFHARMAEEQDAFDFGDVVAAITEKLIRRHPMFSRKSLHMFSARVLQMIDAVEKGLVIFGEQ